ncbi:hypothetical protein F4810DRAFT_706027 [Camillea tinctor]|nr:hypothetical protein F4810DRAFT_706027 [Camillea tinctor]
MSAAKEDYQLSSLAAGFTLGFGFLTVWEAIKQTRRNRNPLRSVYIYMVWGEIVANVGIGIMGWLWLDGIIGDKPNVPLLFFILVFWVFEIQFLMQIIINRIALIAEKPQTIQRLKWGTAIVITMINIAVFCIFIPSHLVPPVNQTYVKINEIWDRASKFLICIVDAALNWFFLRSVKQRLLKQHGLMKYKPLVSFTARLMVVSILMDVMLIAMMWLPNQIVFVQFHPVTYMVKLNIEMTMSSLITKLARRGMADEVADPHSESLSHSHHRHTSNKSRDLMFRSNGHDSIALSTFTAKIKGGHADRDDGFDLRRAQGHTGIQRTVDIRIEEEELAEQQHTPGSEDLEKEDSRGRSQNVEDEMSLTRNVGHPQSLEPIFRRPGERTDKGY